MTRWHGEQWDFKNNEKTMEHSNHWVMTGRHAEQWDFRNNEKTMEHSDHWIMNDGEHLGFFKQRKDNGTFRSLDHLDVMEKSGIFKAATFTLDKVQ